MEDKLLIMLAKYVLRRIYQDDPVDLSEFTNKIIGYVHALKQLYPTEVQGLVKEINK